MIEVSRRELGGPLEFLDTVSVVKADKQEEEQIRIYEEPLVAVGSNHLAQAIQRAQPLESSWTQPRLWCDRS